MRFRRNRTYSAQRKPFREKIALTIYVLPNLLTTMNMFFGFYSIIASIQQDFTLAAYAIVGASVFDLLDGRVARITGATSHFGAEYDSLSDLVSFCMAPGLLMFLWALQPFGRVGWLAGFLFVACGALRLARFNVQSVGTEKVDFEGLPTPMAAGIVASAVLAFKELGLEGYRHWGLLAITFLLSFVMVSNFRYRSFKDLDLKEKLPFKFLVIGVLLFIVVALRPEIMLFVLFLSYAILGAIFGVFNFGKKHTFKRYRNENDRFNDMGFRGD